MNRKQIIITASAVAAAGAGVAAYLLKRKNAKSGPVSSSNGRKGSKHRTEAFSRAKKATGGAPHTEQDII